MAKFEVMGNITAANTKAAAVLIFGAIQVKDDDYQAKSDVIQAVMKNLREVRDAAKPAATRAKRTPEQVIADAVDKPLGELQTSAVTIHGVSMKIPQIFKLANINDHPMRPVVEAFIQDNELWLEQTKSRSQGKGATFLRKGNQPKVQTQEAA